VSASSIPAPPAIGPVSARLPRRRLPVPRRALGLALVEGYLAGRGADLFQIYLRHGIEEAAELCGQTA